MKKTAVIIFITITMLFVAGCNSKVEKTLTAEIDRLNEVVDLLSKIQDLEKEIEALKKDKADYKTMNSLEQEISRLQFYIQTIDVRTRPFPVWNSYTVGFSIIDLNKFMENDYERFVNELHNHIIMVAGVCIESTTDIDGFEVVVFESRGAQVKIKTRYQNGETLQFLGEWTQISFLYTVENGFTLGKFDFL